MLYLVWTETTIVAIEVLEALRVQGLRLRLQELLVELQGLGKRDVKRLALQLLKQVLLLTGLLLQLGS